MNILITFADETMTISRDKLIESGKVNGIDKYYPGSPTDIDTIFQLFNQEIFKQPRGCGYWLWKPYLIYRALLKSEENDYIIYSDAGVQFVGHILPIINAMDNDIMLFSNGWNDVHWTKMDVIRGINGLKFTEVETHTETFYTLPDGYEDYKQVQASNIIFKNTEFSRLFAKEWVTYCQLPGWIDDSPSKLENHPEFQEHRHDQSVLTALAYKYGIKQHWFPSTTNLHKREDFNDRYDPIFNHHRKRNSEW